MEAIWSLAFIGAATWVNEKDKEFDVNFCGDTSDPKHKRYQVITDIRKAMPSIWGCQKCGAKSSCSEGTEFNLELGHSFSNYVREVVGLQVSDELLGSCVWEYAEIQSEITEWKRRENVPNLKQLIPSKPIEEALLIYYNCLKNGDNYFKLKRAKREQAEYEQRKANNS